MLLYKSLLNTAYRSPDGEFKDEIETIDLLEKWLNVNGFCEIKSDPELIFNLQNIRHMMKKLINQIDRGQEPNLESLNKFSEKFKTNQLMQIGKSSTHFVKDTIQFEEPYHSILLSFKDVYGSKLLNHIS